eukprot:TRINITY_DN3432_c0_g1_i11.p3 TRINITY_DN3432_c0_g1~~TRINITY_DN3432_c0_g1_i11.p3  ORF type:complete len:129 (-),score=15.51 TRINITY_DN3432_c0_g1_i11:624-1010(-)
MRAHKDWAPQRRPAQLGPQRQIAHTINHVCRMYAHPSPSRLLHILVFQLRILVLLRRCLGRRLLLGLNLGLESLEHRQFRVRRAGVEVVDHIEAGQCNVPHALAESLLSDIESLARHHPRRVGLHVCF